MYKLLLLEDDISLIDGLQYALKKMGFNWMLSGRSGRQKHFYLFPATMTCFFLT